MKTIFSLKYMMSIVFVLISIGSFGQAKTKDLKYGLSELEINSYFNHDRYPEFRYHVNPTYDHLINIKGNSTGIDVGYKFTLSSKIKIKPFIGYYRFSFDEIDNYIEGLNFHSTARQTTLTPAPGIFLALATDKYYYDCINVGISGEEKIIDNNFISIWGGIKLNNYFSTTQRFYITYDNPDYPIENPHKTNRTGYLGARADAYITGLSSIGKLKFGPIINLPVYTIWKTDAFFPDESNSDTRNKWLNGWGVGVSVSYRIK